MYQKISASSVSNHGIYNYLFGDTGSSTCIQGTNTSGVVLPFINKSLTAGKVKRSEGTSVSGYNCGFESKKGNGDCAPRVTALRSTEDRAVVSR